jgi:hypothetical protein
MQVTPSRSIKKVAVFSGMVIAIAIIGAIFGFLAALIGAQLLQDGAAGFGGLVGALAGMVIGYPTGVAIGIFLINKVIRYRGSLLFGAIGSIIGVVFTIGLAEPLGINNNPDLLWALILLLPPLLGTIGFHLRVRSRGS